jgi:hypothetical protein
MLPWLLYLAGDRDPVKENCFAVHRWVEGKFWGHWVTEPMGVDLRGVFDQEHTQFLRWPLVAGHPTHGAAVLQLLAALLGATLLVAAAIRWWRRWRGPAVEQQPVSATTLLLRVGFVWYGLMLTFAAVRFHRHYLLVTFPLMAVWLARLALPEGVAGRGRALGRGLLLALCVVNALCSGVMLSYLHSQGGALRGGFGQSYAAQVRETGQRPPPVALPDEAVDGAGHHLLNAPRLPWLLDLDQAVRRCWPLRSDAAPSGSVTAPGTDGLPPLR